MQLWLLRHARARAAATGEPDRNRPLADSGLKTAALLGNWIIQSDFSVPETILVSPAVRTRQTAEQVLQAIDGPKPVLEPRLWDALEEDMIHVIKDHADACESLMLIGHNPGMEWLVQWLTNQRLRLGMQPGTLIIVKSSTPLTPGSGHIETVVQPSDLT